MTWPDETVMWAVSPCGELVELCDHQTSGTWSIVVHREVGGVWVRVTHAAQTPLVAETLFREYAGVPQRKRRLSWQQVWDNLDARRQHPSWTEDES